VGWTGVDKKYMRGLSPQQYVLQDKELEYKDHKVIAKSPLIGGGGICLIYQSLIDGKKFASIILIVSDKEGVRWKILHEDSMPYYFPSNPAILKHIPIGYALEGEYSKQWREEAHRLLSIPKPVIGNVFKVSNPIGSNNVLYNYFLYFDKNRFQGITDNGHGGVLYGCTLKRFDVIEVYSNIEEFRKTL
jgi:hypothetical protein